MNNRSTKIGSDGLTDAQTGMWATETCTPRTLRFLMALCIVLTALTITGAGPIVTRTQDAVKFTLSCDTRYGGHPTTPTCVLWGNLPPV